MDASTPLDVDNTGLYGVFYDDTDEVYTKFTKHGILDDTNAIIILDRQLYGGPEGHYALQQSPNQLVDILQCFATMEALEKISIDFNSHTTLVELEDRGEEAERAGFSQYRNHYGDRQHCDPQIQKAVSELLLKDGLQYVAVKSTTSLEDHVLRRLCQVPTLCFDTFGLPEELEAGDRRQDEPIRGPLGLKTLGVRATTNRGLNDFFDLIRTSFTGSIECLRIFPQDVPDYDYADDDKVPWEAIYDIWQTIPRVMCHFGSSDLDFPDLGGQGGMIPPPIDRDATKGDVVIAIYKPEMVDSNVVRRALDASRPVHTIYLDLVGRFNELTSLNSLVSLCATLDGWIMGARHLQECKVVLYVSKLNASKVRSNGPMPRDIVPRLFNSLATHGRVVPVYQDIAAQH